jgi:hypothetical protein
VFGCLANMTVYDLPATSNWAKLLRDHGLLNTFCKMLVPGMAQNDLLLEIVMIISAVASDMQVRRQRRQNSVIVNVIEPYTFLYNIVNVVCAVVLKGVRADCVEHIDRAAVQAVDGEERRHRAAAAADPLLP